MKHTAGPWLLRGDDIVAIDEVPVISHIDIAILNRADVYLICAAPELLDAAKVAIKVLAKLEPPHDGNSPIGRTLHMMKLAVARAEGLSV